ncbi:hypothetical protein WJX73_002750 [Symbiochloris irregularis]|uniref:Uncharacterized protein n=1 Tax=Symbiochloris irregularis TaxID=706552 RepID=A0AAW1PDI7_9CHLO
MLQLQHPCSCFVPAVRYVAAHHLQRASLTKDCLSPIEIDIHTHTQVQSVFKRSRNMSAAAKLSQGALTESVLLSWAGKPLLVDIGLNLADSSFDQDRPDVLQRAVQAAGVHPHDAKQWNADTAQQLEDLASHSRCAAIGECGLDFDRNFSPPDEQQHAFEEQIKLACRLRKPLFMHCRDAADTLADILRKHSLTAPGVVHCFTGNKAELQTFLDMGLCIGITGWVCDDRPDRGGAELAALLPMIPTERLMIETDAPYLVPRTIKPSKARPRRNEPALLPHVLQQVATSLGKSMEQVAQETTSVAERVFGLQLQ